MLRNGLLKKLFPKEMTVLRRMSFASVERLMCSV